MPSRCRTAARLPIAVAMSVLVGLATTVGSAWLLVHVAEIKLKAPFSTGYRLREPARGEGVGYLMCGSGFGPGSQEHWVYIVAVAAPPEAAAGSIGGGGLAHLVPAWAREPVFPWLVADEPWPPADVSEFRTVTGRGWPMIALRSLEVRRSLSGGLPTTTLSGGIPLPSWSIQRPHRILPYTPVWPGLIANTAIYGALWLALMCAPGMARRRLRRRRGCCPACGYSRAGLGGGAACPECGAGDRSKGPPSAAATSAGSGDAAGE